MQRINLGEFEELKSYLGGATNERGGRRKRLFSVTASGAKALSDVKEMRNTLYDQIPKVTLDLNFV